MNKSYKKFLKDSEVVANDLKHRNTIKFNMSRYDEAVEKGAKRFKDLEKAKKFVGARKRVALENLDKNLLCFEEKITKRGGIVLWASNSDVANHHVEEILRKHSARLVVKSKSMTTEEIEFNHEVEKYGVESVETDLGEYIVQVAGEKPYHIVTPAMHKSKRDVNELFHSKFGIDESLSAEELTNFVREKLRKEYQNADVGVTGANFIISDIGAIAVSENEGNALMSTSFPKIHIVIAGIEKVIPSLNDIGTFWPVLATHGTGQAVTVYNSIFTGPKRDNEDFGPDAMYVILLDNKRTELLNSLKQSDSLACIRCGACLNACPVYRNIGGYTYNATYTGPIGSIITPFYNDFANSAHLSFACSVCGKCTEVCPVKIDLHMLLLHNRNMDVIHFQKNYVFNFIMKMFKVSVLNIKLFDFGLVKFKNFIIKKFWKNLFSNRRYFPDFKKSFRKTFIP